MTAVDTSVVVAAFASWHEAHAAAAAAIGRRPRVPAHVLVEAFSVLTRLPPPHRATAGIVSEFLAERFQDPPLVLSARRYHELVRHVSAAGLSGGAIYDALIALTARDAGAVLLTRDSRASLTYEAMKIRYALVS